VDTSMPAITLERSDYALPPKPSAPTLADQLLGIYTDPNPLFRRLAVTPSWGPALCVMIVFGWIMMTFWALKVDVDALQRPVLEQNAQLTASQIDQAIAVSSRFFLPMAIVSVVIRNLLAVLGLGLVFWLFAQATGHRTKPTFRHAVSAATVPNLIFVPYTLMVTVICMFKDVGARIPERLAPSGLAYYTRPEEPRLYALAAQIDPFVAAYFVMIFLALRHTLRLKAGEAAGCTGLAVFLTVAWKVYFWV
jgi:hypothetical protein